MCKVYYANENYFTCDCICNDDYKYSVLMPDKTEITNPLYSSKCFFKQVYIYVSKPQIRCTLYRNNIFKSK